MIAWLAIPVFAVMNRFRGGGVLPLPGETPTNARSQVRRVAFLAAVAVFVYAYAGGWAAAVVAASLLAGLLTGWGVPQGAAGGYNAADLDEFGPLDWLTNRLLGLFGACGERLWGVVWLTLWGAAVAVGPCLVLQSWWPLAWASMGVIYWATGLLMRAVSGNAGDGRELAEWVYGAVLGGTLALAMGV